MFLAAYTALCYLNYEVGFQLRNPATEAIFTGVSAEQCECEAWWKMALQALGEL